jgi:hypothetical protein
MIRPRFGHQPLRAYICTSLWTFSSLDLAPPRAGLFCGKKACHRVCRAAKASRGDGRKRAPGGNVPFDDAGTKAPAAVSTSSKKGSNDPARMRRYSPRQPSSPTATATSLPNPLPRLNSAPQHPLHFANPTPERSPSEFANPTPELRVRPWSSSPSYVRYPAQRKAPHGFVAKRVRHRVTRTSSEDLAPPVRAGPFVARRKSPPSLSH